MHVLPPADAVLRVFVAVPIPEEVRAALAQEVARLQHSGARVGWVAPANLHVTLLFLGDVFGAQIPDLAAALDAVASAHPPFTLRAAGLGYFGSPPAPRVLWAGLSGPVHQLAALYDDLDVRVHALGLRTEERPFHPHVTLGRVRPGRRADLSALAKALEQADRAPYGFVPVDQIDLMQSHLESQGVRYTPLHAANLSGGS